MSFVNALRRASALLALIALPCLAAPPTTNVLRVLFVGNSYTYFNNLPDIVAQIGAAHGRSIQCEELTRGGATFADLWLKAAAENVITGTAWDVVVLQDQSFEPVADPSNMWKFGTRLCDAVDTAGARKLFYLTWAYAAPLPWMTNTAAPKYERGAAALFTNMQERLNDAYYRLADQIGADVAPVGIAFAAARRQHPDWPLHLPDNSHPSMLGSYLAGLVLYAALCDDPPTNPPAVLHGWRADTNEQKRLTTFTVTPEQAAALTRIAWHCATNTFAAQYRPDPRAGQTVVLDFPDLPQTLFARAISETQTPAASVFFPRNYTTNRAFPAMVFLNGGNGGNGRNLGAARRVTRERDFFCINLPLYKKSLEPLRADQSNFWDRLYIGNDDSDAIWNAYRHMLPRLFAAIPNLDRRNVFWGGFSNGGHTTAILLNRSDMELTNYTHKFFLVEGGSGWTNAAALRGAAQVIVMQGALHRKPWLRRVYEQAVTNGLAAEWVLMPGIGHGMNAETDRALRAWLYRSLE